LNDEKLPSADFKPNARKTSAHIHATKI